MKTLKILSGILIVSATLMVCLSSCGSSKSALIGKWEYKGGESFEIEGYWDDLNFFERNWEGDSEPDIHGGTLEFKKDGSYCYDNGNKLVSEPYIVNDGGIVVLYYEEVNNTYRYHVSGSNLYLTSGDNTATFYKAKDELMPEQTVIAIMAVLFALFIGAIIFAAFYRKKLDETIPVFELDEDVNDIYNDDFRSEQ